MSNLLLLGASGFVGKSLQSALFRSKFEHLYLSSSGLRDRTVEHHLDSIVRHDTWDVRTKCGYPPFFDTIIHAATPASAQLNIDSPDEMFNLIVQGMENVIEFASRHQNPPTVLFTSSGAVYGDMPADVDRFPESWPIDSSSVDVLSAYARGKIEAERILQEATKRGQCDGLIARMFAFAGVYLPIDRHFAIGNFVRDVVSSGTITVRGDGTSIRSYMDCKDMASWLHRIIEAGYPGEIYHVGSERSISIRDLASLVASRFELLTANQVSINILGESSLLDGVSRYVPSTKWTRERLNVMENVDLESSIDQMITNALEVR